MSSIILFREDWDKFPEAVIHKNTTNQSFLRLSSLYERMGIRNNYFMLALYNKDLMYTDPLSPDLTEDEMLAIGIECSLNPWYFFREIARAPSQSGSDPIRFIANRGNHALFWLFFNHITLFLIQIRQTGKSFSTDILMSWILNLATKGTEINLLTKDDDLRSKSLTRLKSIINTLPVYLNQLSKYDIQNSEEIKISSLRNSYSGHLPNKSEKAALNVGRGLTSPIFHIDEAAFLYNIKLSLPAALAAGGAARDIAANSGSLYGTIITTTAGKIDDKDGNYIYNLVMESAVWSEKLLDCKNPEDLKETIKRNGGKAGRVNCTFSHRQLGYTDEWLMEKINEAVAEGEDADRDFFNKWTHGNISSPFAREYLDEFRASEKEFVDKIYQNNYIVRWYLPEDSIESTLNSEDVVLGIDTSDASGGDDIAMVFMRVKDGKVLGAANINETNLIVYSIWLVSLASMYSKVTMIIERKSSAITIIDYLLLMLPKKGIDPARRLFNRIVNDREEHESRYRNLEEDIDSKDQDLLTAYKKYFGFGTSATGVTSRTDLYGVTLQNAAKTISDRVHDFKIISQLLTLIKKNGKVDHPPGGNDDMVMAWVLCFWFITNGRNLEFYGINTRTLLMESRLSNTVRTTVQEYDHVQSQEKKRELEELLEKLKNEKDRNFMHIYEKKIRFLHSQMSESDRAGLSIDEVINRIKEEKNIDDRFNFNPYQNTYNPYGSYRY